MKGSCLVPGCRHITAGHLCTDRLAAGTGILSTPPADTVAVPREWLVYAVDAIAMTPNDLLTAEGRRLLQIDEKEG